MLPSLSEQWATAYVQILLTIIIFAIGVPALAMEIIAQEEVRHVAHNRMRITGWAIVMLFVSLLSFYAFVWYLHPPFPKPTITLVGGSGASSSTPNEAAPPAQSSPQTGETPSPSAGDTAATPGGPPPNNARQDGEESQMTSLAASVIVTVVPILAIVFGLLQVSAFRRTKLVKELEDELMDSISAHRSRLKRLVNRMFWKKRNPHLLRDESLHDLIYLGEHGKPGNDKKLVLDALSRVAEKAQASPDYKDGELEALIKGLKTIVINNTKPGEDGDFILVAKVLKDIREKLSARPNPIQHNDALSARTVFDGLCVEAVKHRAKATSKELLKDASSGDVDMVFEVGLAALNAKQFDIATEALTKLEVLADEQGLKCGDETANLLGLLAQFIASQSDSTSRRAGAYLRESQTSFIPSLEECVKAARKHHYGASNYDTADSLDKLLKLMEDRRWLDKLPEDEE